MSMQDIFISPLNVSLLSWREAFAKATLADALPASPTKAQKTAHSVFWLHIHLNVQASAQAVKDGQAWLTSTSYTWYAYWQSFITTHGKICK